MRLVTVIDKIERILISALFAVMVLGRILAGGEPQHFQIGDRLV